MARYKGYQFRSVLESRWARWFDAAGIRWCYEPHGFTGYLPDFYWLGEAGCYVEIRPVLAHADLKHHTARLDAVPAAQVVLMLGGHWYLRVLPCGALVAGAVRVLGRWRTAVWVAREPGRPPVAVSPYPPIGYAYPTGAQESPYSACIDETAAERWWARAHRATQWRPKE